MQAMNGSAGSFRRGRLIGCCMALALAVSALVLAPAANAMVAPPTTTYLALGDSLAFGYSQEKFENNYPNDAPAFFEEGYANFYAKKVKANKAIPNKGLVLVNNGCPGETTDSMIGNGPLGAAYDPEGESPCKYAKLGLPLHNNYPAGAGVSQLESALSILKEGKPAHPITAISLNIGANDELKAVAKCESEILKGEGGWKSDPKNSPEVQFKEKLSNCIAVEAEKLFKHILHNTGTAIVVMDSTQPGGGAYTGPIILNGFYNPNAVILGPGSTLLQRELNTAIEKKLLPALEAGCYGSPTLEKECEEFAQETQEIKEFEESGGTKGKPTYTKPPPSPNPPITNVKFANFFAKFNPTPFANEKGEVTKAGVVALEKYTEMYNAQDIERNEAGTCVGIPCKKHPGGDIHPSKAGYTQIAKKMFEVAPL